LPIYCSTDSGIDPKTGNEFENFSMLSIDDPNYFEKYPANQDNYENNTYDLYMSGTTDFAEKVENKLFLKKAIGKLSAQERRIIYLYYFKGKTFKEIGKLLNITESRISQINKKIMFTLKKELNASTMAGVA
ncbi:MAG: sigma-70 family RNA polymerase sigma factor, partial [Actinobacteria bacterium]|nr:sigma-70 family RNA polymerase sigma factor [Actinomycetota bacterium]